jgi:hypothetical protein
MTTILTEEQPPAFDDIAYTQPTIALSPIARSGPQPDGDEHSTAGAITQQLAVTAPLEAPDEDEELPEYQDEEGRSQLPDYEERHLLEPVVSYNVYQISRKLQILTPATRATFDRPRYRVTARSGPSIFSKKPNFTLTRLPTGAHAAVENCPGKEVGFVNFDRVGQLPWMPRATVEVLDDSGSSSLEKKISYDMCAPNFSDWKFNINNELFFWRLTDKPTALSLMEHSSSSIIARFTYSMHGTDATRGAEVGVLDIFGGSRSEDREMIELVLSTCQVPINHWKNMGRHYKNDVTPRNCSVVGPLTLGNSFFARDGSGLAARRASNAV